jgi:hypothetical protein
MVARNATPRLRVRVCSRVGVGGTRGAEQRRAGAACADAVCELGWSTVTKMRSRVARAHGTAQLIKDRMLADTQSPKRFCRQHPPLQEFLGQQLHHEVPAALMPADDAFRGHRTFSRVTTRLTALDSREATTNEDDIGGNGCVVDSTASTRVAMPVCHRFAAHTPTHLPQVQATRMCIVRCALCIVLPPTITRHAPRCCMD